jgi:hypothetical protein
MNHAVAGMQPQPSMLLALVFPCDIRQLPTSADAIQSPSRLYLAGRYSPPAPRNIEAEASQMVREPSESPPRIANAAENPNAWAASRHRGL